MRVKVIATSKLYILDHTLKPRFKPFQEQYQLDIGDVYTVYGITLTNQELIYLTMDKWNTNPFWHPADVFEIVDNRLPPDWYFYYLGFEEGKVGRAIWGFKEFESEDFYQDLFEREKEVIQIFDKRRKEINEFHGLSPESH
jgi:hypothetical protein